ncbi:hypothetical protein GQ44DRAFT_177599 [Phaeosphaeriaceae sp. PMI808]|nr:hypothetical protein GQ44DRAFT_177599 [Phaeosphaeriaceae sp. PMI808]
MASAMNMCTSCLRAARLSVKPRHIVQLSSRSFSRATATAASRTFYLDFLAPAALKQPQRALLAPTTTIPKAFVQSAPRRALATASDLSAARQAQAIQNPRNDDSGNPMHISISPRASNRLHAISSGDQNPNLALRVTIESGGCHGFQYLMDLTDLNKSPVAEDDIVFQGEKGEKVVIDESSLELLNGSTVDYTMELIGSQFKITGIPGATSSCGCGTSFDIKL